MIDKLIQKQQELGLSDAKFAALLNIPRITWHFYRRGRIKNPSARLARAVQRAFPEDLGQDALIFLLTGDSGLTKSVSAPNDPAA